MIADQVEFHVRTAWQEVLQRQDFGPDDDFFTLGGTSLDAVRIMARLIEDLHIDVSVRALLEPRTLGGMVQRVREQMAQSGGAA